MTIREAARKFATAMAAARTRHHRLAFVGEAKLYCENSDCPARSVTVWLKEFNGPIARQTAPRCPVCQSPLNCHGVLTFAEHEAENARDARSSVNVQRWMRDHGTTIVPMTVYLDETLPL